jgi:regulator of protease activity HflC (stomatin/prohibitin superfamily)
MSNRNIAIIVMIVFAFLIFISGVTIIETGNVGVKSRLGKINPIELKPGLNWAVPVIEKIEPVFTKTVMINYSGGNKGKVDTEEINYERTLNGEDVTGLELGIDLTVEVSPVPDKQADMYIEVGRSGFDKKVLQPIRSVARQVMSSFKAEEIMSKRSEVQAMISSKLAKEFENNPFYRLEGEIQLKKIYLPIKVKNAIEQVQLAKQAAKKAQQQIVKETALADAGIEQAKGEAQSLRTTEQGRADAVIIEAKAKAQAIRLKAEAQAKANKLLAESLSPILIKSQSIQAWKSGGSQVPKVSETIPFIGNIKDFQ